MEQKQGKVQIDEIFYNYLLFDNNKLISLYETKNKLIYLLEKSIKQKEENFNILNLIKNTTNNDYHSSMFFIIYIKTEIIACCRINQINKNVKTAYIDMVFTNPEYKDKTIFKNAIKILIELTGYYFNKYELETTSNNIKAIKYYKENGLKYIGTS